jgi:hypothetical protein
MRIIGPYQIILNEAAAKQNARLARLAFIGKQF